ncbi:hypothetical protein SNOG_09318 [Parastagonospora nodorum SN15]|uniref:Uncharacterized protein n=1 Tax=Phaeosphaeria nodorum (strain SN15 / ATCC MYA-4574 / FGSC 10173) TaxID=321614 RepID=Q0UFZ6_PHANO|nr:hypothetical protein SNOG_09318 [Parastagonospora nodorum SN15]EAT83510.1 hypothetical protein SNOG_09318 [Parastagonospora nodorum SN15]
MGIKLLKGQLVVRDCDIGTDKWKRIIRDVSENKYLNTILLSSTLPVGSGSYTIILATLEAMLEQTKTFISRVSHHAEKTSSPLSPDLILAIQTLKRSSRRTHADPNLFKLLTFLFKITLSTTGPPSSGNADDRLSTIARLKSIEKTDAKHKLCDVLAELEIRE